ncbi:LYSM-DOMAIN RECEPTOR-LIKE KINASE-RELATED [Salix koriyanagi]|uniref:LYSM-DOMAIN RECEPTOR-LIKE KINASE-RELATED n=1 Tax=Salix koriyanagi TaxID=2511006 RepID=A0A9Q0X194_9ROSI|nr:LYSM-DOMAIN RECEPTOR-LIKE KINASE-RELATED [Salix koriyanagi]
MGMVPLISKLYFGAFALILICLLVSALGQSLLSCQTTSADAPGYHCNSRGLQDQCKTFAILHTSSYFSSLSNLSFYLGLNRFVIAATNGFSANTEFLPKDQPLLIPIDCKCSGGFFQAPLTKTTVKGESFYSISKSLEGLTTCKAIREKNPGISQENLHGKVQLQVPLRCACPSSTDVIPATRLLLSYPVSAGDTVFNLAIKFNTTPEAIISANNRSLTAFKPASLVPLTSLLIPLGGKPTLGPLAKPNEPNLHFPASSLPVINPHKKKSKMWKIGVYIAVTGAVVGGIIAIAAAFLVMQLMKKKKQVSSKEADMELQKLSLSVRTTSDKKVSFDESQHHFNSQIIDTTPRKVLVETYTVEELKRATEDFNSGNQIEGCVYLGRLNGKNLAIKRMPPETISKVELRLFEDATHHHPNIIRVVGACLSEGPDSFLVLEYAKNGSLKDWLHGGLAMKNQFIASCYCFLTWNQRLKICLDVAVALHHGYVAPEAHQGVVSSSTDMFSFGVVLLEVLSGQTPITRPDDSGEGSVWLSKKIRSILTSENEDELREWIDSAMGENYSFDEAVTLANIARACTEEDPSLRPTSGEIVEKFLRLVEESTEGEQILICESSCKPLVKSTATSVEIAD